MAEDWLKGFGAAITVCDKDGNILYMNEKSAHNFAKDGGQDLVGRNLLDCHPGKSREKLKTMLEDQVTNCYTIEKNGAKKLIYQAPWYQDGTYKGLAEIIIELPQDVPHYKR